VVISRADVVRYQYTVGTILRQALDDGVTIHARAVATGELRLVGSRRTAYYAGLGST